MPDLSPIPNESSQSLILINQQGVQVELTASKLERWFASVEQAEDPFLATQFISRFGFKKPQDLIVFLKSPGGEATLSLIGDQLAEIAALDEANAFRQQEEAALRRRLIISFLLYIIHKKEAKDHLLRDLMQAEIDKLLHPTDKNPKPKSIKNDEHLIRLYDQVIKNLEHHHHQQIKAAELLEADLLAHEALLNEMHSKYQIFENHLSALEEPTSIATILDTIGELEKVIKAESETVYALIEAGNHELARETLHLSNAKNLQIALLKDMLSVAKGEHKLFNHDGSEAAAFAEADFIIPEAKIDEFKKALQYQSQNPKQLVKDKEGEYYLLASNQAIENLNHQEKQTANKAAKQMFRSLQIRPEEMMSVKTLVHHNKSLEYTSHQKKKAHLEARSTTMAEEISIVANQLTLMQAARANLSFAVKNIAQPTSVAPQMAPLPSISSSSANPKLTTSNLRLLTETFRHMLLLLKNGPSTQALENIKTGLHPFRNLPPIATNLMMINQLKAGRPLPLATLEMLNKNFRMAEMLMPLGLKQVREPIVQNHTTPQLTPFSKNPFKI